MGWASDNGGFCLRLEKEHAASGRKEMENPQKKKKTKHTKVTEPVDRASWASDTLHTLRVVG